MNEAEQLAADKLAVAELVDRDQLHAQFDPSLVDQCDTPDCTIWDLFEPQLVHGGRKARAEFREKDMTDLPVAASCI